MELKRKISMGTKEICPTYPRVNTNLGHLKKLIVKSHIHYDVQHFIENQ